MVNNKRSLLIEFLQQKLPNENWDALLNQKTYDFLMEQFLTDEGFVEEFFKMTPRGKFFHLTKARRIKKIPLEKALELKERVTILEPKLDGVYVKLIYVGGLLYKALTRGDLVWGEDITEHMKAIGVPKSILKFDVCEVVGELVCLKENLHDKYVSPRHAAASYLSRKNIASFECVAGLKFYIHAFGLGFDDNNYIKNKNQAVELGFKVMPECNFPIDHAHFLSMKTKLEEEHHLTVDGLVFKSVGFDTFAVKFHGDSVICRVTKIEFKVGKTGTAIPIVHLEAEEKLEGKEIKKVSGYSYEHIHKIGAGEGAIVEIENTGKSVPVLVDVLCSAKVNTDVLFCSSCKNKLEIIGKHARCSNNECPEILMNRILCFAKVQHAKGIGKGLIKALFKKGCTNIRKIMTLTEADLKEMGFRGKRRENMLASLEEIKTIDVRNLFLLSLPVGFGTKFVEKVFKNLEEANDDIDALLTAAIACASRSQRLQLKLNKERIRNNFKGLQECLEVI